MLLFRKLVVKYFKVLLDGSIFNLKGVLNSFDVKLIFSQSFEDLFRFNAGSLDTERVLNGVLFEKI